MSFDVETGLNDFVSAVRNSAANSRNEAELRLRIEPLLRDFLSCGGAEISWRGEYGLATGRADAVFGRVELHGLRDAARAPRGAVRRSVSGADLIPVARMQERITLEEPVRQIRLGDLIEYLGLVPVSKPLRGRPSRTADVG